jgi:hypothetical protein
VSTLTGLPIGEGQARTAWRPVEAAERDVDELDEEVFAPTPPTPALVEVPRVEVISWDAGRLRQPLRLVGKTVNWQVRRRTGLVETEAGLMSEENLQDIGEPLAEIFNRYEPTRALASRSTELNLALAVYDYVHETAHKAARDQLMLQAAEQAARTAPQEEALSRPAFDGEVPDL